MYEMLNLINAMSPYLLLGFFLAGVMHAFVPQTLYSRYLTQDNFSSVFWATLFGIPLPLCSCGVIPTAMSLRREGASKGATVSFLIATPQTGIDSIIATYSLMGLPFAIARPLAALVTALMGGWVVNKAACDKAKQVTPDTANKAASMIANKGKQSFGAKLLAALRYGYVDMMQDIGKYLIIGLVVAGIITVAVPESFFTLFADNSLLSMLMVLLFALPMYLCATGSIPIAVALMLKGLSPGTALVLLMAGPAVNFASVLVVGRVLGKKTLALYLLSIIVGSVLCGLAIDYWLPREWFVMPWAQMQHITTHAHGYWSFNSLCTIVMMALLVYAFVMKYRGGHQHDCQSHACDCTSHTVCHDDACVAPVSLQQTLKVEGMRCNHCKANVEKALRSLPEVEQVEVSLEEKKVVITGAVSIDKLKQTIQSLGYTVSN